MKISNLIGRLKDWWFGYKKARRLIKKRKPLGRRIDDISCEANEHAQLEEQKRKDIENDFSNMHRPGGYGEYRILVGPYYKKMFEEMCRKDNKGLEPYTVKSGEDELIIQPLKSLQCEEEPTLIPYAKINGELQKVLPVFVELCLGCGSNEPKGFFESMYHRCPLNTIDYKVRQKVTSRKFYILFGGNTDTDSYQKCCYQHSFHTSGHCMNMKSSTRLMR